MHQCTGHADFSKAWCHECKCLSQHGLMAKAVTSALNESTQTPRKEGTPKWVYAVSLQPPNWHIIFVSDCSVFNSYICNGCSFCAALQVITS